MVDTREGLGRCCQLLHPNREGHYQHLEAIGAGASCIAYRAEFVDGSGFTTDHLLKEYYPVSLHIARRPDGSLEPDAGEREKYEAGLHRFREGYTFQRAIRRTEGLMNSTSNIQDVFDANGTTYIDMTVMNGQTYTEVEEPTLYQLLRHMKALAKVIGNYHKAGFLHLDIKPDNIFVYPETPEMLLLFDFDSVVKKDDTFAVRCSSYTEGWAAPEQLTRSKRNKICEATDLYAIGEIIFQRLFGRHSGPENRRSFSSFGYDVDSPFLRNVNPRVYPLLTEFLHKTICVTPEKRYQNADELLRSLDELIRLADPGMTFVKGNFTYQSAGFSGREELLSEIDAFFHGQSEDKGNALFLNGVGGIGKTELAKRYAYLHQQEYARVLFLPFQNSIEETLCQDFFEIYHGNVSDDEEEDKAKDPQKKLYASRLRLLKEDLTPQDLLILDNFDTFDEKIQDLLEIDCRILVTTRLDVSDYNYPQRTVRAIREMDTLWEIFRQYNQLDYTEDECTQIETLIDYVDRHTMTVCLIAKYLKENEEDPAVLLEAMKTREGITATQDSTRVRHRKDRRMTNESVEKHLRILFDLSHFSQNEIDLLAALSLLGPVRIAKDTAQKLLDAAYRESTMQNLVKAGWVELSRDNIVSLHQIILDLSYKTLVPECSSFAPVVQGMLEYMKSSAESIHSRRHKLTLVKLFWERICRYLYSMGEEALSAAEMYYLYHTDGLTSYNEEQDESMDKAEAVCDRFPAQESTDLLFRFKIARIRDEGHKYEDTLVEHYDDEDYLNERKECVYRHEIAAWKLLFSPARRDSEKAADVEEYIKQLVVPDAAVCDDADRENLSAFLRKFSVLPDLNDVQAEMIDKLLELAKVMDSTAEMICGFELELTKEHPAYALYLEEACILRYAYLLAVTTKQDDAVQGQPLQKLAVFYSEEDTQFARISVFADPRKMSFYAFEARRLREKNTPPDSDCLEVTVYPDDCGFESYVDTADDETRKGNYKKAIELLELALENQEDLEEELLSRMAWNYIQLYISEGHLQDAYDCLLDTLTYDQQYGLSDVSVLMTLADVCERLGRKEESAGWYNVLLDEHCGTYDALDNSDKVEVLLACALRAELGEPYRIDEELGQWLVERLREFDACDYIVPKLSEVYQKLFDELRRNLGFEEIVRLVLNAAGKLEWHGKQAEMLYLLVCEACRREERDYDICFESAVKAVNLFSSEPLPNRSRFLALMEELSQKPGLISELSLERYHILQADLYYRQSDSDPDVTEQLRKKCNYYLVAEHDAKACASAEDAVRVWEEAREAYSDISDYANGLRCCEQLDVLLAECEDPDLLRYSYSYSLDNNYEARLRFEYGLNDTEGMHRCVERMYALCCRLAVEGKDAEDYTEESHIESLMRAVIEELASPQDAATVIFIGLLRIHRRLSDRKFCIPAGLSIFDPEAVGPEVARMVDALPETVPDDCRDDIQETMELIAPLYAPAFPESAAAFERFQRVCSFCGVEEKHIK